MKALDQPQAAGAGQALEFVKIMTDLVAALVELGVPLDHAQGLLSELASSLHMAADACILVQYGDTAAAPAPGWHDGPPLLSNGQLAAAADRGAALERRGGGFALFQRLELLAPEVSALVDCIDTLAAQGPARRAPSSHALAAADRACASALKALIRQVERQQVLAGR
jgi:hypothetical protein